MRGYIAFVGKELTESLRTYRALILLAVFFLFGMMSPLLAKLMPEIFKDMDMAGLTIMIPTPTAIDAYTQLFKNITQMGMIVVLLVFGGSLSGEISRGTLLNMLTRGLSRSAVVLAKFTASLALWTTALALAGVTTYGYTVYLFPGQPVSHLAFSLGCLWLFGALVLALIPLSSTLVPGHFGGLALTAAALGAMLLVDIFPHTHRWNPIALASDNVGLITGTVTVGSVLPSLYITTAATVICLAAAVVLFRRSKL